MNLRYARVAERASHRCEYCHAPEVIFNFPFEVEHIIPPQRGGQDEADNWALACRACNLRKSDHVAAVDPETNRSNRLFNPRLDSWDEHFLADKDTGQIIGTTPLGRATAACLQMNAPTQLTARILWFRLALFL